MRFRVGQAWPSCRHFGALQLAAGERTVWEGFVLCWTDIGCDTVRLQKLILRDQKTSRGGG